MEILPGPLPPGQPRDAVVAEVAARLRHLTDGAAVCVATSGGPDSTALAFLAAEARPDLDVTLVHVRHGLRDDAADRDTVAEHAAWLGVPLVERRVTVARDGHGIEAAARDARYRALREAAAEIGAAAVLVGHTADDQAETVLLRLARGTGVDGLRGMRVRAGDLVRPLLRVRRADVRRFVLLEGLPSVEDPTNVDRRLRRNLVRHDLLPSLGAAGPDPVAALCRLADLAGAEVAALDDWTRRVLGRVRRAGPVVAVRDDDLAGVPVAIARRAVRDLVRQVSGDVTADAATVARVLGLAAGSAVSLKGGVEATFAGGWRALAPSVLPQSVPRPLAVPGLAVWPPARVAVRAVTPEQSPPWAAGGQIAFDLPLVWRPPVPPPDTAVVPPGGAPERLHLALPEGTGPLTVRHRRPGDRLRTGAGTRRLKDVLVDAGVPRAARDVWPVVAAGDGPVWVPGVAVDEDVLRRGRRAPVALLVLLADPDEGSTGGVPHHV